jgi:D-3-phosphoglycerate dehydrogenase
MVCAETPFGPPDAQVLNSRSCQDYSIKEVKKMKIMKILIADKFPDSKIKSIKDLGCDVVYNPDLKEEALLGGLNKHQPDILVVRSTVVSGKMITAVPGLNLVIRAGSGYNTIDIETASERSVYVSNCPGMNSIAVAELAFGLILSIDRRIPDNVVQLRGGKWNKKEFSKSRGIFGKTLGIIGTGRIGKQMIPRAKAFGMHVCAWSRSLDAEKAEDMGIKYCISPEQAASEADIVTIHLALTADTQGFIGSTFFDAMKPGAYLINTSRSEIVNHVALKKAIDEKGIWAGLDVFESEPAVSSGEFKNNIAKNMQLYGTHHIGASTEQAQSAVADEAIRVIKEYINTGKPPNCVNLMKRTPARFMLSVHHRNRVGILAGVLDIIRDANNNVEVMENIIFEGAEGACARIQIDGKMSNDDLDKIEHSSPDILSVAQVELI